MDTKVRSLILLNVIGGSAVLVSLCPGGGLGARGCPLGWGPKEYSADLYGEHVSCCRGLFLLHLLHPLQA